MSVISGLVPPKRQLKLSEFPYKDWIIRTSKSCIMTKDQEDELNQFVQLPHFPDMLFTKNGLSLQHSSLGFGIRFDPIEALKTVNPTEGIHVSMSKLWLEARSKHADINKIAKPYDWTFTPTNYKGSILNENPNSTLIASPTEEKIDYERLKVQETIVFFDEIILYEDELDDNGISKLSLKIRAMPSGVFILQRFFLRVDDTLIRCIDTRVYHDWSKDYILREYSERESKTSELNVSPSLFTHENEIVQHLKLLKEETEMLKFSN